jgi:hypothetical protein
MAYCQNFGYQCASGCLAVYVGKSRVGKVWVGKVEVAKSGFKPTLPDGQATGRLPAVYRKHAPVAKAASSEAR